VTLCAFASLEQDFLVGEEDEKEGDGCEIYIIGSGSRSRFLGLRHDDDGGGGN
jgi:hypothetical protein